MSLMPSPNMRLSLGDHTVVDMFNPKLHGEPYELGMRMEELLVEAAREAQMTILFHGAHISRSGTITAHVVISESHIVAVFRPKEKVMLIDIFTCGGENFDKNQAAQSLLIKALRPETFGVRELPRGPLSTILSRTVNA